MKRVVIHIGELYATAQPAVIETVLGSCVSACLFDPVHHIGGMNHIFLPGSSPGDACVARYGVHAMELLMARIVRLGGEPAQLQAKVFGAANVLRVNTDQIGVARENEKCVREFLAAHDIPLLGENLGGCQPLKVKMYAHTGRVLVKPLATHHLDRLIDGEKRASAALARRWEWFEGAGEILNLAEHEA